MASTETVTIACKLPHGLQLRVYEMVERDEMVVGGGLRKRKVAVARPEVAYVYGWSHPQNAAPKAQMVGGYALTPNVSKDLWDRWLQLNGDSMMVKNGLIFAHGKTDSTVAQAKDGEKVRSGLERLDPKNLPRRVETSDLMPKKGG
jgi:hypothetical protein